MDITTALHLLGAIYNAAQPLPPHYHPLPQTIRRANGGAALSVRLPIQDGNRPLLCLDPNRDFWADEAEKCGGTPFSPTLDDLTATDWAPTSTGIPGIRQPQLLLAALERPLGERENTIRRAAARAAQKGQPLILLPHVATQKVLYWDVVPTNTPGKCLWRTYGSGCANAYLPNWVLSYGAAMHDGWTPADEAIRDGWRYATEVDRIPDRVRAVYPTPAITSLTATEA